MMDKEDVMTQRKNCFVKISGDVWGTETVDWISSLSRDYDVTVCVDGGRQIKEASEKTGLPIELFEPLGRSSLTSVEQQIARDALEQNYAEVHEALAVRDVHIRVVVPVVTIGTVPCYMNGDQFVLIAYNGFGFDRIEVVTTAERFLEKKRFFYHYRRISIASPPLFRGRKLSYLESRGM